MIPYTYLIGWSAQNRYYYGARWSRDCDPKDLWTSYFTSSKHVKEFRKKHGEPDIIQVRQVFSSVDKCRLYESKVLRRLNVIHEDKWLNKNINGYFLPYGPQSPEHLAKRKAALLGRPGLAKERNPFYGKKHTPETIQKMSIPKTEEHKAKLPYNHLNKKTVSCPHCDKTGQYVNMKRWHFDNCRFSPKVLGSRLQTGEDRC